MWFGISEQQSSAYFELIGLVVRYQRTAKLRLLWIDWSCSSVSANSKAPPTLNWLVMWFGISEQQSSAYFELIGLVVRYQRTAKLRLLWSDWSCGSVSANSKAPPTLNRLVMWFGISEQQSSAYFDLIGHVVRYQRTAKLRLLWSDWSCGSVSVNSKALPTLNRLVMLFVISEQQSSAYFDLIGHVVRYPWTAKLRLLWSDWSCGSVSVNSKAPPTLNRLVMWFCISEQQSSAYFDLIGHVVRYQWTAKLRLLWSDWSCGSVSVNGKALPTLSRLVMWFGICEQQSSAYFE